MHCGSGMALSTESTWYQASGSFCRRSAAVYHSKEFKPSREQEAVGLRRKCVGGLKKCCISVHTPGVDTDICSICCHFSAESTVMERRLL
ncbi:hypothetical protein CHARACLAT_007585 [Characodon lateralis]|uniref:Uncharacterized protein n=1 Tax=Characodon lateralis TaxID=208331 RepID=A0ABU7E7W7_9TELE|nr:hypothetical protein [Characodon lateralis]